MPEEFTDLEKEILSESPADAAVLVNGGDGGEKPALADAQRAPLEDNPPD